MRYNHEACTIELTLKSLCALGVRRGDLDRPLGLPYENDVDKEMYFKLQSEAGAYYSTDTELTHTARLGNLYVTITTTADGIIRHENGVIVDKIRTSRAKGFYSMPDLYSLAMLKCTAYFFAKREGLEYIEGRISCYATDKKKLRYYRYRFLTEELEGFYFELLERVRYRFELCERRAVEELLRAEHEVFPYTELRDGQEQMVRRCYGAIKHGHRIFVEAPTGTGKTMSALFPAVRALGEGYCDKIFYLTPKMSTRREAFAAAAKLNSVGNLQRTVMLTAKEQMCPCRESGMCVSCDGESCEYARGYYDRLDGALREMTEKYRGYSRTLIASVAQAYKLCPYELSLDLSELCDIIICDYNYAFDISVYLRRYFGRNGGASRGEKYVFLIDEVHNLTERAREMYSATLRLSDFERAEYQLREASEYELAADLVSPAVRAMTSLKNLCSDELVRDEDGNERGFYFSRAAEERLSGAVAAFLKRADAWLYKNKKNPIADIVRPLRADAAKYLSVLDFFDESFRFYCEIFGGDITARLYCLDPSDIMDGLLTRAVSCVMFSATLTPPDYFRNILGGRSAESVVLRSPFPHENLCVAVADYINTRFDKREESAKRFATVIAASVSAKKGNYIAYFPSYACLEMTYKAFAKKYPRVETVVQKRHMSAAQREEFLSAFRADEGHLRVGFCVLGGMFSEGVDLPGSRLIGSIIFGVGLPGLSNEKNMVREYFDLKNEEGTGYDYAYTFPGMNNVLQASGRVIRREDDRGIVVLCDDRYSTPKYRALFPAHWQGVQYAGNASSVAEIIRRFWEKQP